MMPDHDSYPDTRLPLLQPDQDSECDVEKYEETYGRRESLAETKIFKSFLIILLALSSLLIGFSWGKLSDMYGKAAQDQPSLIETPDVCKDGPVRREWRTLSKAEKAEYIRAVQCLRETPSMLGLNQSIYDDFPWVHSRFGEGCASLIPIKTYNTEVEQLTYRSPRRSNVSSLA